MSTRMRRRFMIDNDDRYYKEPLQKTHIGFHARDEIGLEKAYASKNKTYIDGNTESLPERIQKIHKISGMI